MQTGSVSWVLTGWGVSIGFELFWPIWFHSQNPNDMLGVWDKAALPWTCSTVATGAGIWGKWLSLHHNLDRSGCSALSFGHRCTRGPLCASITPPCRPAITAQRAQWQNIIKWNVKSKRGQRMVFTTGLRFLSEMKKWIYCCDSLCWADMLQIESMKYGVRYIHTHSLWVKQSSCDRNHDV